MKKVIMLVLLMLLSALPAGCTGNSTQEEPAAGMPASSEEDAEKPKDTVSETVEELADGTYTAEFHTDSGMFHINEACDGKGKLTVKNGEMTIHISLASKNIVNLYPGPAVDAQKEGAELLLPTEDTVTYSDGWSEEVYGFDVPVPVLDEEFDLALIGIKGKWYNHKVWVSDPAPSDD